MKEGLANGSDRRRRRHARAARQVDRLQAPRPADHRRGAAFRRHPQGAAEEDARGRARPDAVGDAHPAHAAAGADRRARAVAHHHAAGRSPRRAHLHLAVRSDDHPRCPAPRALPRRPELLRRAAHLRSRRDRRLPARGGAGADVRARHRPVGAERAGRRHDRLLRRQVRRAAVDRHRRIRPRPAQRQHADRAPRRYVRPRPALSAARPRRPLQGARLRLLHHPRRQGAQRSRRQAPEGAAVAGHARRRLLARLARPRHPRRRQPAGRGAVGPHPRGRLRALPVDARGGRRLDEGRRSGRRRRAVEPDHFARHLGAHSRRPTSPTCTSASASTAACRRWRRARRSTALPPSWSIASGRCPRRSSTCST